MDWKAIQAKMIDLLTKAGLIPADKADEAKKAIESIDAPKPAEPSIDPSKVTDPVMKQVLEKLAATEEVNKQLLDSLKAERTERDKAVKIQQDEAKKSAAAKVDALVAQALKEGKIVKAGEADFKTLAETNFTFADNWLKTAPVDKSFKPEQKKDENGKVAPEVKPTSLKTYVDNKEQFNAEALAALTPSKN